LIISIIIIIYAIIAILRLFPTLLIISSLSLSLLIITHCIHYISSAIIEFVILFHCFTLLPLPFSPLTYYQYYYHHFATPLLIPHHTIAISAPFPMTLLNYLFSHYFIAIISSDIFHYDILLFAFYYLPISFRPFHYIIPLLFQVHYAIIFIFDFIFFYCHYSFISHFRFHIIAFIIISLLINSPLLFSLLFIFDYYYYHLPLRHYNSLPTLLPLLFIHWFIIIHFHFAAFLPLDIIDYYHYPIIRWFTFTFICHFIIIIATLSSYYIPFFHAHMTLSLHYHYLHYCRWCHYHFSLFIAIIIHYLPLLLLISPMPPLRLFMPWYAIAAAAMPRHYHAAASMRDIFRCTHYAIMPIFFHDAIPFIAHARFIRLLLATRLRRHC